MTITQLSALIENAYVFSEWGCLDQKKRRLKHGTGEWKNERIN